MFSRWDAPLAGVVFLVALWVNLSAVAMTEFHRDEALGAPRALPRGAGQPDRRVLARE